MHLKPLPVWIPEVYRLHQRLVDIEGYVALNSNRYSVPVDWIGRRVEVRETRTRSRFKWMPAAWSRTGASPKPSTAESCSPSTGRRVARERRVRIPKRKPLSRQRLID